MARRLARIALWLGAIALLLGLLELLGVPAFDWIRELFDKVDDVPPGAIVAGVALESAQTSLAALAWYGILRAALPSAVMPFRLILASYAVAVALNGFLPANLGTFVMLVMFTVLFAVARTVGDVRTMTVPGLGEPHG